MLNLYASCQTLRSLILFHTLTLLSFYLYVHHVLGAFNIYFSLHLSNYLSPALFVRCLGERKIREKSYYVSSYLSIFLSIYLRRLKEERNTYKDLAEEKRKEQETLKVLQNYFKSVIFPTVLTTFLLPASVLVFRFCLSHYFKSSVLAFKFCHSMRVRHRVTYH